MENRIKLFNKTCNTLIEAWREGNLFHGNCNACAVGNICGGSGQWANRFVTRNTCGVDFITKENQALDHFLDKTFAHKILDEADVLIKSTGYTQKELMRIEWAFETSIAHDYVKLSETSEGQYIGLCAVMEVLWDIHGVEDQSLTSLNEVATSKGVKVEG